MFKNSQRHNGSTKKDNNTMIKRRQRFHSTGSLPNFLLSSPTNTIKLKRCLSLEPQFYSVKPILKAKTLDESLGSIGRSRRSQSDISLDSSSERSIQFHEIQIREYARTVGDNPSCSSGPPMAIAWEYDPKIKTMKLEDYEELRPRRRSQMEMVIPRHERYRMLREEWNIPTTVIAASVRNAVRVKHQRRVTVSNLHADKWEEMVERASRKVTRTLLFRKSTTEKARQLEEQCDEANLLRNQWMLQMMARDKAELKSLEPMVAVEQEDSIPSEIRPKMNQKQFQTSTLAPVEQEAKEPTERRRKNMRQVEAERTTTLESEKVEPKSLEPLVAVEAEDKKSEEATEEGYDTETVPSHKDDDADDIVEPEVPVIEGGDECKLITQLEVGGD